MLNAKILEVNGNLNKANIIKINYLIDNPKINIISTLFF